MPTWNSPARSVGSGEAAGVSVPGSLIPSEAHPLVKSSYSHRAESGLPFRKGIRPFEKSLGWLLGKPCLFHILPTNWIYKGVSMTPEVWWSIRSRWLVKGRPPISRCF